MSDANYVQTPGVDDDAPDPADVAGSIPYTPVELMGRTTPPERAASRMQSGMVYVSGPGVIVRLVPRQPGRRQVSISQSVGTACIFAPTEQQLATMNDSAYLDDQTLPYDGPIYVRLWSEDGTFDPGAHAWVSWVGLYDDGES